MSRNPSDIVAPNLRIREALRRKLEAAAKRHQVSLNAEMVQRLTRSFEQEHLLTLDAVVENVTRKLLLLLRAADERPPSVSSQNRRSRPEPCRIPKKRATETTASALARVPR